MPDARTTATTRSIEAPRETVYRAFTDPDALVAWRVPGEMTATIHEFDAREGGGYRMSLFYSASEPEARGKTAAQEDRFTARFVELSPRRGSSRRSPSTRPIPPSPAR